MSSSKPITRIIVTPMSHGRALALHSHRKRRVRKKYQNAMVIRRPFLFSTDAHTVLGGIFIAASREGRAIEPIAIRRIASALKRTGVDARPWLDKSDIRPIRPMPAEMIAWLIGGTPSAS